MASDNVADLFSALLFASSHAHILHLQSRSYSEHMALDELYKGLPELVDSLIEAYQGLNGIVTNYTILDEIPDEPIEFIEQLRQDIVDNRDDLGEETEIQNLTDEIVGFLNSITYKLRFLS